MNTTTHARKYYRQAASLGFLMCIMVNLCILSRPTTFSWADNGASDEQPRPLSVFVPLLSDELQKLNQAAREELHRSPARDKAVTHIHHANVAKTLFEPHRSILIGTPVIFQVLKDTSVTVVTDRLEQSLSGILKWYGHVPGDPNSSSHLLVNENERSLIGHIRVRKVVYEIRPTLSGAHTIFAIDPTRLPPDRSPHAYGYQSGHLERGPVVALAQPRDNPPLPQIDLMILYTQEALTMSEMDTIGSEVCIAEDQVTEALAASGVRATVRLVHHGRTELPEDDNIDTFLSNLTNPIVNATGHELRNKYGADVVSVWVSDKVKQGDEGLCGKSQILYPPHPGLETAAYSIVLRSCAINAERFSFAHELGHVLGANHDRYYDEAGNSGEPNWDYVNPEKGWRTIMAYDRNDCPDSHCNRINQWSNPDVANPKNSNDWTGRPADTRAIGCTDRDSSTSGCDGPANNKLTLDRTVPIVANFRPQASTLGNVSCGNKGGGTRPPTPPGG